MSDTENEEIIHPSPIVHKVPKTTREDETPKAEKKIRDPSPEFRQPKKSNKGDYSERVVYDDFEAVKQQERKKYTTKKIIPRNGIPLDYDNMDQADVAEYREIFKMQYAKLAKENEGLEICYPGDHAHMSIVHSLYFDYLKSAIAHINCQEYQIYLIIILLSVEFFATKFLHLPLSGFTTFQLNNFNRYRKYLLEMGEDISLDGSSTTPPWIRLLTFAIFQMIIFGGIKILSSKIGNEEILQELQKKGTDFIMDKTDKGLEFDEENGIPTAKKGSGGMGDINIENIISGAGKLFGGDNGLDLSKLAGMVGNLGSMFSGGSGNVPNKKPNKT